MGKQGADCSAHVLCLLLIFSTIAIYRKIISVHVFKALHVTIHLMLSEGVHLQCHNLTDGTWTVNASGNILNSSQVMHSAIFFIPS
jgi:hypothetical protein